ncbi:hypothetical protein EJB05_24326, partial [Eragrostis curvula]
MHSSDGNLALIQTWSNQTSPCNWDGIACSAVVPHGHDRSHAFPAVTSISLAMCDLSGRLDGLNFADLPHLVHLDLRNNLLYGEIPSSIDALADLSFLDLSFSGISGSIPPSIGAPDLVGSRARGEPSWIWGPSTWLPSICWPSTWRTEHDLMASSARRTDDLGTQRAGVPCRASSRREGEPGRASSRRAGEPGRASTSAPRTGKLGRRPQGRAAPAAKQNPSAAVCSAWSRGLAGESRGGENRTKRYAEHNEWQRG